MVYHHLGHRLHCPFPPTLDPLQLHTQNLSHSPHHFWPTPDFFLSLPPDPAELISLSLDQQMRVVGHQDVGVEIERMLLLLLLQQ
jgi:hypothetical protein